MRWVSTIEALDDQPNKKIAEWLTRPYILSQALRQVCQHLTVRVISQQFSPAFPEEYPLLSMEKNALPWIREVLLEGDGIAFTTGRVVIPPSTYEQHRALFSGVGDQPIGEAILYNNPLVTRGAFEYTVREGQWGRRSVFRIALAPLLVVEFMLSTLPDYPVS